MKEKQKFAPRPRLDSVFIQKMSEVQTSQQGIIIPDTVEKSNPIGKIISKGSKCSDDYNEGDTVIFNPYANLEITYKGQTCLMMRDMDIYAVIPPDTLMFVNKNKRAKADIPVPTSLPG